MPHRLVSVTSSEAIPDSYHGTPIGDLLRFHNLKDQADEDYVSAQILIGMCMDNRKQLAIPPNFAFIIRSGGVNLRFMEFQVTYALAIGGVKAIALIAHNQCGMVNLMARKDRFIRNLVRDHGWEQETAEEYFMNFAPMFEVGNEIDFIISEAQRLRRKFSTVLITPMMYRVEDNLLYLLREE
jgi:carbonic anhydrase